MPAESAAKFEKAIFSCLVIPVVHRGMAAEARESANVPARGDSQQVIRDVR